MSECELVILISFCNQSEKGKNFSTQVIYMYASTKSLFLLCLLRELKVTSSYVLACI